MGDETETNFHTPYLSACCCDRGRHFRDRVVSCRSRPRKVHQSPLVGHGCTEMGQGREYKHLPDCRHPLQRDQEIQRFPDRHGSDFL